MSVDLIKYKQPLTQDELSFLRKKEKKERKQLYKAVRVFMIMCFVCPFIVAWFRAIWGGENPFSFATYFLGVAFLLCFSAAGVYWSYYNTLRKVHLDIKYGTKTIEKTFVTRKQYMPTGNAYYVYLSSAVRLSIEVSEEYYRNLHAGDEINIEYTSYSNQYLGYF